jgi:hypothetical protein
MFDFFDHGFKAYNKRSETMLREAMLARLEHEAAAEHHMALARMYTERVARLQREAQEDTQWDSRFHAADAQDSAHPHGAGDHGVAGLRDTARAAGLRVLTKNEAEIPQALPRAS